MKTRYEVREIPDTGDIAVRKLIETEAGGVSIWGWRVYRYDEHAAYVAAAKRAKLTITTPELEEDL